MLETLITSRRESKFTDRAAQRDLGPFGYDGREALVIDVVEWDVRWIGKVRGIWIESIRGWEY